MVLSSRLYAGNLLRAHTPLVKFGATSACSCSRNLARQSEGLTQSHDRGMQSTLTLCKWPWFCRLQQITTIKNMNKYTTEELSQAIETTANELGYSTLKRQQQVVISSFVSGKDVFVALPTGFGKSPCYGCLPGVFTKLFKKDKSIVIVVSPLTALMQDQVDVFKRKGLPAVSVTRDTNPGRILRGDYQVVFISPEQLLTNRCYRMMGSSPEYCEGLIALVIDEAHCVKKWYVFVTIYS